ncbi:MAG: AMP-binding protein [Methylobacteriaceae bacterium]|nr:AMP-binding protein [Methylobacteriaceae bacterium]
MAFETQDGALHSYADVEAGSARMAGALIALGVKPGDRVAVQIEKSLQAVLLYLGCARAGAVFLPLNTAAAGKVIFHTDAEATVFVAIPPRGRSPAPPAPPRSPMSRRSTRTVAGPCRNARASARRPSPTSSAGRTISPAFSTRRARPGDPRAR